MDELAEVRLCGFVFAFGRLAKARAFVFQRIIFELHFRGVLLIVVLLFVVQVCDQLIHAMRNSDPRTSENGPCS